MGSPAQKFSEGAGHDYLRKFFGGAFRETEVSLSVGTSVVLAAARDGERVSLTFVNLGATQIFISPSTAPSSSKGIRIGPNGGLIGVNVFQDGMLPLAEWNAIGDLAGGTLYVLSARRENL